jgi:hypothetical protein
VADNVAIQALVAQESAALHLHYLTLGAGGTVRWTNAPEDFCGYVVAGTIEVNGVSLDQGGCFVVEHGGAATILSPSGAEIGLFRHRFPEAKHGGNVHLIHAKDVPFSCDGAASDISTNILLADASCQTCNLWLHGSNFTGEHDVPLHSHSVDEIILTIKGDIILGNRSYGPGTALAVAQDVIYGFGVGPNGLAIVNFRAASPTFKAAGSDEVVDEAAFQIKRVGRSPEHIMV